jgi:hypothetical protein
MVGVPVELARTIRDAGCETFPRPIDQPRNVNLDWLRGIGGSII